MHAAIWGCILLILAYELPFASSSHHHTYRLKHSHHYTRTRPYVGNVTCNDRNFRRTLTWIPHNVTDNLRLLNYSIQFCPTTECSPGLYDVICYGEDGETKLHSVNSTYCKTSLKQLIKFAYNTFKVQGIFNDILTNKTVRSKAGVTECRPIEATTTLGPPTLVANASKNHIKIDMSLPEDLQKTLRGYWIFQYWILDIPYTYYFCVYEQDDKGANCTENSSYKKKGLNPTMTYELLKPDTQYTVRVWYVISEEYLLKSEEARLEVSTLPDPFPQWLQTAVICIVAVFIILVILGVITGTQVYKRSKDAKLEINKAIPKFLEEAIEEARRCDGVADCNASVRLLSDWTVLQAHNDQASHIPPIRRVVQTTSQRAKELSPSTGATDVRMDHAVPSPVVGEDKAECKSQKSSQCSQDDGDDGVQYPRGFGQACYSHESNTAGYGERCSQADAMQGCQIRVNTNGEHCGENEAFLDTVTI